LLNGGQEKGDDGWGSAILHIMMIYDLNILTLYCVIR